MQISYKHPAVKRRRPADPFRLSPGASALILTDGPGSPWLRGKAVCAGAGAGSRKAAARPFLITDGNESKARRFDMER